MSREQARARTEANRLAALAKRRGVAVQQEPQVSEPEDAQREATRRRVEENRLAALAKRQEREAAARAEQEAAARAEREAAARAEREAAARAEREAAARAEREAAARAEREAAARAEREAAARAEREAAARAEREAAARAEREAAARAEREAAARAEREAAARAEREAAARAEREAAARAEREAAARAERIEQNRLAALAKRKAAQMRGSARSPNQAQMHSPSVVAAAHKPSAQIVCRDQPCRSQDDLEMDGMYDDSEHEDEPLESPLAKRMRVDAGLDCSDCALLLGQFESMPFLMYQLGTTVRCKATHTVGVVSELIRSDDSVDVVVRPVDDGMTPLRGSALVGKHFDSCGHPTASAHQIPIRAGSPPKMRPGCDGLSGCTPVARQASSSQALPSRHSQLRQTPDRARHLASSSAPAVAPGSIKKAAGAAPPMWLADPRDAQGRSKRDNGHDPSSLMIPSSALQAMSQTQRQYWRVKAAHYDVVILMKIGKFFETFHEDAHTCHKVLGLGYMKVAGYSKVGFPAGERCFNDHARKLVASGFKVGRVEQKEQASAENSQVLERELVEILTPGTMQPDPGLDSWHSYILGVAATVQQDKLHLGVCFMDCFGAHAHVGAFTDDCALSLLSALLQQLPPREVVLAVPEGPSSPLLTGMHTMLSTFKSVACVTRIGEHAEWSSQHACHYLSKYWSTTPTEIEQLRVQYPDALGAVGGVACYLASLFKDHEVLSHCRFSMLLLGGTNPGRPNEDPVMLLDGPTISQLHLVEGESGMVGGRGSLLACVDRTKTAAGKRLLARWMTTPLRELPALQKRQCAIQLLVDQSLARDSFRKALARTPDLERVVVIAQRWVCSPVVSDNQGKERLEFLLKAVLGVKQMAGSLRVVLTECSYSVPDAAGQLGYDLSTAARCETAISAFSELMYDSEPLLRDPGVRAAKEGLQGAQTLLDRHLDDVCTQLGCPSGLKYSSNQQSHPCVFEVPVSSLVRSRGSTDLPAEFMVVSQTAKTLRFRSELIVLDLLARFTAANARVTESIQASVQTWFKRFCQYRDLWRWLADACARFDVLSSLAEVSSEPGMCRPQFVAVNDDGTGVLEIVAGRHPCIPLCVPNTVRLGVDGLPHCVLVTGPNMGGKSTTLRLSCVIVILAQLGCNVPAERCKLSPVDQIFTRIGAQDNIMGGMSTYFVELSETAKILREATPRSLVILDELGRGTSTLDGTSIAYAVTREIVEQCRSNCLFATHYHILTEEFKHVPQIGLWHMAFRLVGHSSRVNFLYQLAEGPCPNSFGMNVGQLAGLPAKIVDKARTVSSGFELQLVKRQQAAGSNKTSKLVNSLMRAFKERDTQYLTRIWSQMQ